MESFILSKPKFNYGVTELPAGSNFVMPSVNTAIYLVYREPCVSHLNFSVGLQLNEISKALNFPVSAQSRSMTLHINMKILSKLCMRQATIEEIAIPVYEIPSCF